MAKKILVCPPGSYVHDGILELPTTWDGQVFEPFPSYLMLSSTNTFTLHLSSKPLEPPRSVNDSLPWDGVVEYSQDAVEWHEWDGYAIGSNDENKLYLRGSGNTRLTGITEISPSASWDEYNPDTWQIQGENVEAIGVLDSLLDWRAVKEYGHSLGPRDYAFAWMFWGCSALVKAPVINGRGRGMCYATFDKCVNLTEVQESLGNYEAPYLCYSTMFANCSSLTKAPKLPANRCMSYCYESMFAGCSSLTEAPDLPARELYTRCYAGMFALCRSLVHTPKISATSTINASEVYADMFEGCTSLEELASIKAIGSPDCCKMMYWGCSKIKMSETQNADYYTAYSIPSGSRPPWATPKTIPLMFEATGGTFTGDAQTYTTYYTNNTIV